MKSLSTSITLLLLLASPMLQAQPLPLWELGVGSGALHLPMYRGAKQTTNHIIPFPYLIYRGENITIDDGLVRGYLLRTEQLKLDISISGGVPVTSDGDTPRSGMPDLDPTIEIGPSLDYRLWKHDDGLRSWWLKMPLRAVQSLDIKHVDHQGWSFSPFIEFRREGTHANDWKVGIAGGPLFADQNYHDYYYQVTPEFATPQRPVYTSKAGYSGSRLTLSLQKNIDKLWFGAFLRYDNLKGAKFEDSPLVNDTRYVAIGLAFTWIFMTSEERVERDL